jgi:type VII secretion integral membrane protein EccD
VGSSTTTGFCRVTVVAPDSRIDVALPEDIPLADVYPELLSLSGQALPGNAPPGFHLVRRDGTVLDSSLPLIAQQIRDGDLLSLRPFAESLPAAVYDDVADAVAATVAADRSQWTRDMLRTAGLAGAVLLLALLGLALWCSDPAHDMHSLPGLLSGVTAVLLIAFAGVRARVYDDRGSALALGLAALPHALIGGSAVLPPAPGEGPGRIQFLAGCVAVLIASMLLTALMPGGDAPFVAAVLASGFGTLAAFSATVRDASPREAAAVAAVVATALVGFLPQLSVRFARLPVAFHTPGTDAAVGDDPDPAPDRAIDPGPGCGSASGSGSAPATAGPARIAAMARRGHELLAGLVGGCAAVVVGCSAVLSCTGSGWSEALALALGLTALLRARLFRHTAQVLCLLLAGLSVLGLLVVGVSLGLPHALQQNPGDSPGADIRTIGFAAAVALGAALSAAVALTVPARGVSPFWGRVLDLADLLLPASLIPLALGVLPVYALVRGLTP